MKTNVLPLVVENLLENANLALQILECGDLGGKITRDLRHAVVDAESYKKQLEQDDLITLHIEAISDPQQKISITMPKSYIRPDNKLREQTKELFLDYATEFLDDVDCRAYFEDECPSNRSYPL